MIGVADFAALWIGCGTFLALCWMVLELLGAAAPAGVPDDCRVTGHGLIVVLAAWPVVLAVLIWAGEMEES